MPDSLIEQLRSVKCTAAQTDLHRKWDEAIERCVDIVRQHEAQDEQEDKAFMKATQLEENVFEQKLQAIENPSDELLEVVASAIADIYGRLPDGSMYDSCREYAKAALSALNNCGPLKSMGDASTRKDEEYGTKLGKHGTNADTSAAQATSPTTHTLNRCLECGNPTHREPKYSTCIPCVNAALDRLLNRKRTDASSEMLVVDEEEAALDNDPKFAFENWYVSFWGYPPPIALNCKAHEGMTYGNLPTENSWKAWKAAWDYRGTLPKREYVDIKAGARAILTSELAIDESQIAFLEKNLDGRWVDAVDAAKACAGAWNQNDIEGQ